MSEFDDAGRIRLQKALAQAGVEGPPARMEWIEVAAHRNPGG